MKTYYSGNVLFTLVTGLWLAILMHLPLYNLGGSGFVLPQNIITWGVAAFLCGGILSFLPGKQIVITPFLIAFIAGSACMTIPLLWSENQDAAYGASVRICGLWAGVLLYFCLLQITFTQKTIRAFLWFITLSATIEGCIVLQALFLPQTLSATSFRLYTEIGRGALGTFQQVNVTASWLATGLAAQMLLLVTSEENSQKTAWDSVMGMIKLTLSSLTLAVLACCIVLTCSRIGWIGGVVSYLLFLSVLLKSRRLISLQGITLMMSPVAGMITGLMLLESTVAQAITHTGSNYQRLLTLKETLKMIMQHPFKGWGMGTFRIAFQDYMASHFVSNPSLEVMGHPHNELLYIWFEGGIIALAGYLLVMLAIVWLVIKRPGNQRRMTGILLLPVMLHTWTEFPFYYSAAHFVVLLILIVAMDLSGRDANPGFSLTGRMGAIYTVARCSMLLASACIVLWLVKAFHTESMLSHFEEGTLKNPECITQINVPLLTRERYLHDLNLLNLVNYYSTGEKKWLRNYLTLNAQWIQSHPDPDDYDNQIQVLRVIGKSKSAERCRIAASRLFPWDARFSVGLP
ncbi:TPA: O-antigen ligase C-terminal domain-containing protein [Enterobacter bugandensis]|nr:O-antigen ligase C-terminal domain-containing protein [Enterobacter bugandensis]